jgi:hypothetical protein
MARLSANVRQGIVDLAKSQIALVHDKQRAESLRSGGFFQAAANAMYDAGILSQERFAELMVRGRLSPGRGPGGPGATARARAPGLARVPRTRARASRTAAAAAAARPSPLAPRTRVPRRVCSARRTRSAR